MAALPYSRVLIQPGDLGGHEVWVRFWNADTFEEAVDEVRRAFAEVRWIAHGEAFVTPPLTPHGTEEKG